MENSHERPAGTRMQDTGLIPPDSFKQAGLDQTPDAPPPYVKEPLFNKKVMAAWALGALAVWFGFSIIAPIVFESTRAAVREAMKEAATSSGGTITIHRSRDGKIYTVTRKPDRSVTITTAPAPVAVPSPAAPAAPADPRKAPEAKK